MISSAVNPWIRLYRESLHDPKIVTLSDRQHRAWHNLLLVADDNGALPSLRDVAAHLRMPVTDAEQLVNELVDAELVDVEVARTGARTFRIHGWAKRQFRSDSSTERSRKHRAKSSTDQDATLQQRSPDVAATPSESESESETESERLHFTIEQDAPREQREGVLDLLRSGSAGADAPKADLIRRAEGLGLPVEDLLGTMRRARPKNASAYFRTLCVSALAARLPRCSPALLSAALSGKPNAAAVVMQALVEAPAHAS